MTPINPTDVRYIKLGSGGRWADLSPHRRPPAAAGCALTGAPARRCQPSPVVSTLGSASPANVSAAIVWRKPRGRMSCQTLAI